MPKLRVPILMYHKIDVAPKGAKVPHHYVTPKRFASHVRALKSFGYQTVTLGQAVDLLDGRAEPPEKPIVLTFDDGYQNFETNAMPSLVKGGSLASVFVVTGQLGGTNAWDTRLGDVEEPLMSAESLRRVAAQGIEIGSHTVNHARLSELSLEEVTKELADSRATLGTLLGQETKVFCYPYGSYTDDVRSAVIEAGYQAACSVEKGWNSSETDRFLLKRVNVRSDTSSPILFWKLWRQGRKSPPS